MKKQLISLAIFLYAALPAGAQKTDSIYVLELNQEIDNLVVQRDIDKLKGLYADDFVFNHGTGKVEGKMSWLQTVARADYPLRQHDSVKVELHPGVAVVKGKMDIKRNDKDKQAVYHLRYIRIYALRNKQWQMISHNTTEEKHDN